MSESSVPLSRSSESVFHFALSREEATALIELGAVLERHTKRNSPLDRATLKMDEQMANQCRPWEKCGACNGTGWVEYAA